MPAPHVCLSLGRVFQGLLLSATGGHGQGSDTPPKQKGSAQALTGCQRPHGKHSTKRQTKPSMSWLKKGSPNHRPCQPPAPRHADQMLWGQRHTFHVPTGRQMRLPKTAQNLTEHWFGFFFLM